MSLKQIFVVFNDTVLNTINTICMDNVWKGSKQRIFIFDSPSVDLIYAYLCLCVMDESLCPFLEMYINE